MTQPNAGNITLPASPSRYWFKIINNQVIFFHKKPKKDNDLYTRYGLPRGFKTGFTLKIILLKYREKPRTHFCTFILRFGL